MRNLCRSWIGGVRIREGHPSARPTRGLVPQVALLEGRALLSAFAGHAHARAEHAAHFAPLHRHRGRHGPLSGRSLRGALDRSRPYAPPGDFGTVTTPTLVQHPDPITSTNPIWKAFREYSYGSSERNRFYLAINPGSKKLAFFAHGGGFAVGRTGNGYDDAIVETLFSQGYSVASIEYPLLDEVTWPGPVRAIADGMIAANRLAGAKVTRRVFVGASAGATAGALILYSNDPQYPTLPFRVDEYVGASGAYMASATSPGLDVPPLVPGKPPFSLSRALEGAYTGLPKTSTPALLIGGDHDAYDLGAGTENSTVRLFARYLIPNGNSVVVVIIDGPDGDHVGPTIRLTDPQILSAYNLALSS